MSERDDAYDTGMSEEERLAEIEARVNLEEAKKEWTEFLAEEISYPLNLRKVAEEIFLAAFQRGAASHPRCLGYCGQEDE